jgi:Fur family ferric uptake transcriptional regulator
MLRQKTKEAARKILTDYLREKGYRKTPERYAVLEEIYSRKGHFDIETLHVSMKEKKFRVSLATLYNTIDILLKCKLIKKHQFGKNITLYERAYPASKHDHLIDTRTGKITEFFDPRVQDIVKEVCRKYNFKFSYHTLYIYGEEIPDKQINIFKSI